jgi:predicted permease
MRLLASSLLQVMRAIARGRDGSRAQLLTISVSLLPCLCLLTVLTDTVWKPLPFTRPGELYIQESDANREATMEAQGPPGQTAPAVEGAGLFTVGDGTFSTAESGSIRTRAAVVSKEFLPVLAPSVIAGKIPSESEVAQSSGRPVLITEDLWRESLRGNRDVIGSACRVNGIPARIYGVAPASQMLFPGVRVWMVRQTAEDGLGRGAVVYRGLVRLRPGMTAAIASQQLEAYARRKAGGAARSHILRLTPIAEYLYRDHRSSVNAAILVAACLLVIGLINCVAVCCFELLRHQRDMAIKLALGSSFGHLTGEVICRQQAYALGGWLIAALLCPILTSGIAHVEGLQETGSSNYLPNLAVLLETLGIAFCGTALVALAQLGILRQLGPLSLLQEGRQTITGSRKGRLVQGIVLLSQFTITTAMSVTAGAALFGYWVTSRTDLGFDPTNVLVYDTEVPSFRDTPPDQGQMLLRDFETQIRERLPMAQVGAINSLPLDPRQSILLRVQAEASSGNPPKSIVAGYRLVQGDYFAAMGIRLVSGRFFDSRHDRPESICALIMNQELARRLDLGREPVGQNVGIKGFRDRCEVVGVVSDIRHRGPREQPLPEFFLDYDQAASPLMSVVVQPGVPQSEIRAITMQIALAAHAGIVVAMPNSMAQLLERQLEPQRNRALTVASISVLAMVMIQLGLFGLVGQTIVSQTRRLAVELALGAPNLRAARNSLGWVVAVVVLGIAAGDALALLLFWRAQDTFGGFGNANLLLVCMIDGLTAFAALIAFYAACRKLLRLDPSEAFRSC